MFSGIVQSTAAVTSAHKRGSIRRVRIEKPRGWRLTRGQSVSVDGICSTVVTIGARFFEVEYMPETLRKTTAHTFAAGSVVNLERSLKLRDYIDGHIVLGHVDSRGTVRRVEQDGDTRLLSITVPAEIARYLALHGSVAVNGVSLTIARKKGVEITISLIPHTCTVTNLGMLRTGMQVNIEVDMIARYIFAALTRRRTIPHHAKRDS